jgi:3-oxoacyl-[acyl-carrier protein] reductase
MKDMKDMKEMKDKLVLVTGASRGIGAAIAQQCVDLGAYVMGTATTLEGAQKIEAMGIHAGAVLRLDAACEPPLQEAIADLLALILKRFDKKGPDILVNNAGMTQDNLMLRMSDFQWNSVIQANLSGTFYLTKQMMRHMLKERWGRIVNMSSVVGVTGNAGQVNYAAAKAGLLGFTKSLALEIASRGITVNAVAPGFIRTDMTDGLGESVQTALLEKIPTGRLGTSVDIAGCVAFLLSDAAAYITGHTLHVNGGLYMA